MTPKSFSVRMFLQDGHADGVKILAKSKWTGRGLVIPRDALPQELDRKELDAPGIYLLVDSTQRDELPTISLGATAPVCRSLRQAYDEEGNWDQALVFSSKSDDGLPHGQVALLANRLVQLAQEVRRSHLMIRELPATVVLPDTERAEAEVFLDHVLSLLPLLGVTAFEPPQNS